MSKAIQVRSFEETRAEVEALKAALTADTAQALDLVYAVRDQALTLGEEDLAWKVCTEAADIMAAYRAAKASLDRFVEHIEAAEKS